MKECLLCSQFFSSWNLHKVCCREWDNVSKQTPSFVYHRVCIFCKNCFEKVDSADVDYHRKTCHRNQKKKSKTSLAALSKIPSTINLRSSFDGMTQNLNYQQIEKSLLVMCKQILVIFLNTWLKKTQHIQPTVLTKILSGQLNDVCIKLSTKIPNVNIQELNKKYKGKIIDILKSTKDIFDVQRIQPLIEKSDLPKKMKDELITELNNFLTICKWQNKYKKGQKQIQQSRDRQILLYRELIVLVLQFFKSKSTKRIHLGLDLLILFHSAQRFPSSFQIVCDLVPKIMQSTKNYCLIERTTKTKTKDYLIISEKLKRMLKKFRWKSFLLTKWQIGRLSSYFNFSFIALRRGFFIQMINNIRKDKPHLYTNHKSDKVADIYLQELILRDKLDFHQKLIIPVNEKELCEIVSYDLINKVKPQIVDLSLFDNDTQIDWEDFNFDFFNVSIEAEIMIPPQFDNQLEDQKEENIQNNKKIRKEVKNDASYDNFHINGVEVKRINWKFDFSGNFCQYRCQQTEVMKSMCIYCQNIYETLPLFCECLVLTTKNCGVVLLKPVQESKEKFKMPQQYLNNSSLFNQVRFFLHRRGTYVSNSAVAQEEIIITDIEQMPQSTELRFYEDYLQGKYFPPLQIMRSGEDDSINGTGVGLFAIEPIESGVFIGEYGGDIMTYKKSILARRKDCLMNLTCLNSLQIGSLVHSSYVQLINSSQNGNCMSKKLVAAGKLIIIIYTIRRIQIGEELLYDYIGDFRKKFNHSLQKYDSSLLNLCNQPIHQPIHVENSTRPLINTKTVPTQTKNQDEKYYVQNLQNQRSKKKIQICSVRLNRCSNSCYADSVIVVLKLLSHYFKPTKNKLVADLLSSKGYDMKKIVEKFLAYLKKNKKEQEDFDEFFVFVRSQLNEDSPFNPILVNRQMKCQECSFQTRKLAYEYQYRSCQLYVKVENNFEAEKLCGRCNKNAKHSVRQSVESTPQILILNYSSTELTGSKRMNVVELKQIQHKGFIYKPIICVYHHGNQTSQGHYVTHDVETNKVYDQGRVRELGKEDFCVCLIILERVGEPQEKSKEFGSGGVYIRSKSNLVKQNLQKYYNIASIIKIVTYFTCERLRGLMKLPLNWTFSLPKSSQIFGISANLKENQQFTIEELYYLMLIPSACDAAYCLSYQFGQKYKQWFKLADIQNQKLFRQEMMETCFNLQMNNTFIEDAWGLGQNLSCVKDMETLLKEMGKDKQLLSILGKKSIRKEFDNTNLFCQILPGKTGTHATGSSFIGQNQSVTCIMLESSKEKIEYCIQSLLK